MVLLGMKGGALASMGPGLGIREVSLRLVKRRCSQGKIIIYGAVAKISNAQARRNGVNSYKEMAAGTRG